LGASRVWILENVKREINKMSKVERKEKNNGLNIGMASKNLIILITAIVSLITAIIGLVQSEQNRKAIHIQEETLIALQKFDIIFGNGNWFVFPDDNFTAIGVKRLPKDFLVRAPIKTAQTDTGKYGQGDLVPGDCGAYIELEVAWQRKDIPLWQRDYILKWKDEQKLDTQGIISQRLDKIFGKGNWHKNPLYDFSIIVTQLKNDLPIKFPITNVDANNLKYGVGPESVKAGQKATIWLAGNIQ